MINLFCKTCKERKNHQSTNGVVTCGTCGRTNLLIISAADKGLRPTIVVEIVELNSILYAPVTTTKDLLSIPKVFHGLQVIVEENDSIYRYDSLRHSWQQLRK